jgi:hypothetical protein
MQESVPRSRVRCQDRPCAQLRRLLDQLEADEVLMVTRLDRLARSTRDLLNTIATITGKKAGFRSLGADTTTSHGRLMLTVWGGLAEFERDLIRARTGEGRERRQIAGNCTPQTRMKWSNAEVRLEGSSVAKAKPVHEGSDLAAQSAGQQRRRSVFLT